MKEHEELYLQNRAAREQRALSGLYRKEDEHDACGVGLLASMDAIPSRRVVEYGIMSLQAVWHRGAVDADGKTGDGAGIGTQIPREFFRKQIKRTGHEIGDDKQLAVGMVFLPRTDFGAQETCRTIVEAEILNMGHTIYGWRHVPVNTNVLGEKAGATRPEIEQILISDGRNLTEDEFERNLYIIRRRIERAVNQA
ncbi:MAG: glutamate synthase large subunit, partial [Rhodobacteraceae bacterium]|nr:glutamate synthase large subunit [Paracoccaceae bacterium]